MIIKIEQDLKEKGLQARGVQRRSLYSIVQQLLPAVDEKTEAELVALEKLFER
ncbi:hypothetical protein F7734_01030 [Scytonema sp. UIC 10036]|uniref:hypothetical protein n=1 Tax=Scytonema sp. UIC 10036 TaxID=2304196 RepID=UPI0012DA30BF|nr:hypothetical protein [Scytonema sp. UIC 10036]MUG91156.1 hypothetical protein [Scytonema sp. UIC 10036]